MTGELPPLTWPELERACRDFGIDDTLTVHPDDVRDVHLREFGHARDQIRALLNALDRKAMVVGWRLEFFPHPPGKLSLRRPREDDLAELTNLHADCMMALIAIMDFTETSLQMTFENPDHSRLLSFSVENPGEWDPHMVGTTLQYLADRNRMLVAQVTPNLLCRHPGEPPIITAHPRDPDGLSAEAVDTLFAQSVEVDDDDCDVRLTGESSDGEQEDDKTEEDEDDL